MPRSARTHPFVLNLLLALAYAALGHATLTLSETGGVELRRVLWLPSGLAVAVGLLVRARVWPGAVIGGALATWIAREPGIHVLGTGIGNGLEVALAVGLLRRVDFLPTLDRVRDVLLLMGLAFGVAALGGALVSVGSLAVVGGVPDGTFVRIWMMWWITHAMGILTVVPVALTWSSGRRALARRSAAEVLGVLTAVAVSAWVPFMADPDGTAARLFFLPFPFLLWAAIRLGMAGAATGAVIVAGAAMTAAIRDWGPLSGGSPNHTLVLTWVFANVVMVATLMSAALVVGIEQVREAYGSGARRLRAVLDATGDGIVVTDAAGTVVDANRAMVTLGREELDAPVPGESIDRFLSDLTDRRRTEAGEPSVVLRHPIRGSAAGRIDFRDDRAWEYETEPLVGPEVAGGRIWIFRDVTERLQADEERKRLEAQVLHGQKLESLGVLAGGIAHDFNNLLMGIQGRAELLKIEGDLRERARDDVEGIIKTTGLAAELCRQMLAYAGRSAMEVRTVDLSECAREIQELLRVSVSRRVDLRLDLTEEPLPIEGDGTQLRQVLLNLVTNASEAISAAERPGTVTIRTRREVLDEEWLSRVVVSNGLKPGAYAVAEVVDDGVGMDDATAALIFDPFFSSKGAGRGLGLAATLGVIRSHHGGLVLDTRPHVGTRFQVALPLTGEGSAVDAPPVESGVPTPEGRTILVVDDEDEVREVVVRMLDGLGFRSISVPDGPSALAVLKARGDVDLVVLDLTMPRMSGLETLAAMRGRGHLTPVLVASGYSSDAVPEGAGVVGFVQKPFRREMLESWLGRVFPLQEQEEVSSSSS